MSAIEMIEDTDLKSGASVRHTEEGLRSSLSNDERVLARFGKRQQLRVRSRLRQEGNLIAHSSSREASEHCPRSD